MHNKYQDQIQDSRSSVHKKNKLIDIDNIRIIYIKRELKDTNTVLMDCGEN